MSTVCANTVEQFIEDVTNFDIIQFRCPMMESGKLIDILSEIFYVWGVDVYKYSNNVIVEENKDRGCDSSNPHGAMLFICTDSRDEKNYISIKDKYSSDSTVVHIKPIHETFEWHVIIENLHQNPSTNFQEGANAIFEIYRHGFKLLEDVEGFMDDFVSRKIPITKVDFDYNEIVGSFTPKEM